MSRSLKVFAIALATMLGWYFMEVAVYSRELSNSVKQLREQRLAVLQEIYDLSKASFNAGEIPAERVQRAKLDVLQAKLDLAVDREERHELLKQAVMQAEQWESILVERSKAGEVTRADALQAKALVLRARIELATANVVE